MTITTLVSLNIIIVNNYTLHLTQTHRCTPFACAGSARTCLLWYFTPGTCTCFFITFLPLNLGALHELRRAVIAEPKHVTRSSGVSPLISCQFGSFSGRFYLVMWHLTFPRSQKDQLRGSLVQHPRNGRATYRTVRCYSPEIRKPAGQPLANVVCLSHTCPRRRLEHVPSPVSSTHNCYKTCAAILSGIQR